MPRLKHTDTTLIEEAMSKFRGAGYVLEFSDRTFTLFFQEEFGIDIDHEKYAVHGGSKGKRLRTFLSVEDGTLVARVLRTLWDQRASIMTRYNEVDRAGLPDEYFQIVHRLQGDASIPSTDAIERFTQSETLDELVAAIQRDIAANKPQAVLDRLHTYCMKKFAHLIEARGGTCDKDDPLHSRAGKYIKALEAEKQLQPISTRIMKSSISIFEEFNNIRNNRSLAHDNELIDMQEARFIFDAISCVLRFVRSIEATRYGS
jgi:hypothetical protein